jgi:HD-like signal output (HDOD) protein
MQVADLRSKLNKHMTLPSLPQIVMRIRQVSENPKSSVADLANCILSDQQLTSRILRTANSSYYGEFAGKVSTITQAIVLMGFRAVRNIAISTSVYGTISKLSRESGIDVKAFWARSVGCGVIAKYLVQRIGKQELIEAAFIAGLLHDVGQVVLARSFPKEYEKINAEHSGDLDIHRTEKAIIGMDHQEAGSYISKRWGLPPDLAAAISEHHRVDKAPDSKSPQLLTDLIYLGDIIYAFLLTGRETKSEVYQEICGQAKTLIGIDVRPMEALPDICRQQISEIARDLDISIDNDFEGPADGAESDTDVPSDDKTEKELQLACLQNASVALAAAEEEDTILSVMCETAFRGLKLGRVILLEHNSKKNTFDGRLAFGLQSSEAVSDLSFPLKKGGLLHSLFLKGKPFSAVSRDPKLYGPLVKSPELDQLQATAFAIVPIAIAGVVKFVAFTDLPERSQPVTDETIGSIISLANQTAMVLDRNHYRKLAEG